MKRKLFIFFILLSAIRVQAQFVPISDSYFQSWLQSNYPSCMSGGLLDTTCTSILAEDTVFFNYATPPIADLTEIQYFKNLQSLTCHYLPLPTIGPLPNSLKELTVYYSSLTNLPTLPSGLIRLNIQVASLTSLPALPSSLLELYCSKNQITVLPALPSGLLYLGCGMNQITVLPALPAGLTLLNCQGNELTALPSLPSSLRSLLCDTNNLTSLPPLPSALQKVYCSYNSISSLPALSDSLLELECRNNQLTSLPILPDSLKELSCGKNQLTSLPAFPSHLTVLHCDSNQISCFPNFPLSLIINPFPYNQMSILNNPFTCLPNYVSGMDSITLTYPLCVNGDAVNNPNGCEGAQGITGRIYSDDNSNCLFDGTDSYLSNIQVKLYDVSNVYLTQTTSLVNGNYFFSVPSGTYTVRIDTVSKPYIVTCAYPGIDSTVVLSALAPQANHVDFPLSCRPGFDVGCHSIYRTGNAFPGQQHVLTVVAGNMPLWYNFNCPVGIGGEVIVKVTGPVTYVGPEIGALTPVVVGNTYTYSIANFDLVNMNTDFRLVFTTNTSALAGDLICVDVTVNPISGDNNLTNNNQHYCYPVVNSCDPNLKEVYPEMVAQGSTDYLTYTIYFQNTGTAPAMNIRISDPLDADLDYESFQEVSSSHYNTIEIHGTILTFHFPNIQLADSTSNEPASHGFVQYRLKPKPNRELGTQIKNTAYIYFDYNAPVATNTVKTDFTLSLKDAEVNMTSLRVYPNPSNGVFVVDLQNSENASSVEIHNTLGECIYRIESGFMKQIKLDLSTQPSGIYFVTLKSTQESITKKLVKMD